jgi:hypothetical protein
MPNPGVGYTASSSTSSYVLGILTSPPRSHQMDLSALPANGHSWVLPQDSVAYEKRYGAGTAQFDDSGFKKWVGSPQNELKYVVVDALTWWGTQNPSSAFDGHPNDVEITDVQATNDMIWRTYLLTTPGFSPGNPQHVNDASKPHGAYQEMNSWWGMMNYYFNDYQQPGTGGTGGGTGGTGGTGGGTGGTGGGTGGTGGTGGGTGGTGGGTGGSGGGTGTRYHPHHAFLAKVPYSRMRQAFGKRWAWPMDLVVQNHNLQNEVLDAWIASLDGQGEENPIFVELQKEFGP